LGKVGDEVPTVKNGEYFADAFDAIQELVKGGKIMAGHDISAGGLITTLLEMNYANTKGGMEIDLKYLEEKDFVKVLFAENPGVVIQIARKDKKEVLDYLDEQGVSYAMIGYPIEERVIRVKNGTDEVIETFDIDTLRDFWMKSSYLLDRKQSGKECAKARYENYKKQPLNLHFLGTFEGTLKQYGITADRKKKTGVKAAIIREKGTNGEREMAYAMWLAGMDVKDVHMTDLASGRETLEDVNFIVFCGGFSNSDVLGSAKGWAGAFRYNEKARMALEKFYARKDTLSLGICNGCQLMVELDLLNPDHEKKTKMLHNVSHKFESSFVGLSIQSNKSVLLGSMSGEQLGVWVAHGEGRFSLPMGEENYDIVAKYTYKDYPANPNGSDYGVAGICSSDGRHLAMMPHPERAIFPWQWAYYPESRKGKDEVSPWIEMFVNARKWIESIK